MKKQLIELDINDRKHEVAIEPSALLLDVVALISDLQDQSADAMTRLAEPAPC